MQVFAVSPKEVVVELMLVVVLASGCEATVTPASDQEDDSPAIAAAACELMTTCVSSLVSIEECTDIQIECRSKLDDPEAWDDHMAACIEIGGCEVSDAGAPPDTAFVECVQAAPRPPECESIRP